MQLEEDNLFQKVRPTTAKFLCCCTLDALVGETPRSPCSGAERINQCYGLLIHALLSYALLSYALLSYALLSYALLSYALLSYALLSYALLSYALLSYALLSYALLCCGLGRFCYVASEQAYIIMLYDAMLSWCGLT